MLIWSAMLIPVLTAAILYAWFQYRTTWWELLVPVGASLIVCLIMKYSVETYQTNDTEYWTGWVQKAEYYEAWTETWTEIVTDSDGNSHIETHVDYHPPTWNIVDSNGISVSISSAEFKHFVAIFGNKTEVGLFHGNQSSWGDGDMYYSNWNRKPETFTVATTLHTYENRIQASDNVLNYPDVEDTKGLFEYPVGRYDNIPSILGASDYSANKNLSVINAKIGKRKQVRIWFLVFRNQPIAKAIDQEALWKGGNKNEFVVCIGTNSQKDIDWAYVFSWSEVEQLKAQVKMHVLSQETLDLNQLATYVGDEVSKQFRRKQFADFSYIAVDPPIWAVLVTFLITILVNGGLSYWLVKNGFHDRPNRKHKWVRGRIRVRR